MASQNAPHQFVILSYNVPYWLYSRDSGRSGEWTTWQTRTS